MTYLAVTAPHAASGELLEMYRRQQQSWGYVPNYALAFGARPRLMARRAGLVCWRRSADRWMGDVSSW